MKKNVKKCMAMKQLEAQGLFCYGWDEKRNTTLFGKPVDYKTLPTFTHEVDKDGNIKEI